LLSPLSPLLSPPSNYLRVFLTFARNSLVRDMTFRANFLIDTISSISWVFINLGFYTLLFRYTPSIGVSTGWEKYQFFLFLATALLVNSLVQAFFMTNADELSELVRTGGLDFALLKPIDTQFLVSLTRIEWSSLGNFVIGLVLMVYALFQLHYAPGVLQMVLYPLYVLCGVAIYYSLMIALAATSVWLGRNQTLFDFWFYITNFSRYPMEIYHGPWGTPLRRLFTFCIPVLVVVNVPARILVRPLMPHGPADWLLPGFALLATVASLAVSRWVFQLALRGYRSASS
jgi:ABC-2 type transport system permease protein